MITLYDKKATDYTTNGLVVLDPYIISAKISERMNGEYKLDMELAVDQRTMVAANEMIIKAPAPIRETPQIDVESTQTVTREIYKVTTGGQRLYLRVKPTTSSRAIKAYAPGTEVAVIDKSNSQWYKVAVLYGGASGYMYTANLTYVRSETQSQGVNAPQHITTPAKTRDQLFRISKITSTLESIQIEALHISYDMRRNYVKSAAIKGKTGADALAAVFAAAMTASDFTLHSDIDKMCEEDIAGKSLVAALLSDGGLVDQASGEVLRDNYDLYWYNNIGYDRGVSIAYRKNMAGMEIGVDTSDIVTQIVPVGYDKKNNPIYGDPVDSEHVAEYAHPYIKEYAYKDVKIGKDYKNEAAVKTELAKRAAAEYDAKIDLPKVSATVEYVDLKNTSAGRDFAAYTNVYIGDTVRIRHEDYGFDLVTKVVAYVWDCVVNEYESIELDNKQAQLSDIKINPSMIGNGTLASRKLGVGAVMNVNMAENSVESDQIAEGAIDSTGKMTQLVVDALSAEAVTAIRADIRQLVAGQITTDQLYVDLAAIAVAQITTANIDKANIDWATIKNLTAAIANIANASIGTAKIDWAKIYDLTADTAIITEGVGGKLYIARLAVTEANMTSLTVGELMVKAKDGSFKRITVDADGSVKAETVQVEGGNVADNTISGGKLIENTITARELNVEAIFADTALIRAIKAANIDVSDLFAAEATISELNGWLIKAETITALQGQLNLWASEKINLAVGALAIGGTNLALNTDTLNADKTVAFGAPAAGSAYAYARFTDAPFSAASYIRVDFTAGGSGANIYWFPSYSPALVDGKTYTWQIKAYIADKAAGLDVDMGLEAGGLTTQHLTWSWQTFNHTFTYNADSSYKAFHINGTFTAGDKLFIADFKIEGGDKATAWTRNPDEINKVQIGSNILIDEDHIRMNTSSYEVNVSGENGDFHADENGLSAKVGNFETLTCPEIVKRVAGRNITITTPSGLQAELDRLNGGMVDGSETITLACDQYGDVTLRGIYGNNTALEIVGGYAINGNVTVVDCHAKKINFDGVTINSTAKDAVAIYDSAWVRIGSCTINTSSEYNGIVNYGGSIVMAYNTGIYNAANALNIDWGGRLDFLNLKGTATTYLWAKGCVVTGNGSRPSGNYVGQNVISNWSDMSTIAIDTGSGVTPPAAVTTTSYTANVTGTYYPSGHWINSDNIIRQGFEGKTSTRKDYGCMWFGAGGLSGKTIKSATLTLKRISGRGRSGSVTLKLWTTTLTGKSGKPTDSLVSLGEIGTIGNGVTETFNVPVSAIATIAAGGGFVLYTEETANASGKDYSRNYAHFEGTDGNAPVLTVTYQ
nr:MAG TPA: tail protein [Caudoviricetes sp.]